MSEEKIKDSEIQEEKVDPILEEKIKDSEIQQEKVDPILEEKEEKKEISLEKKLTETEDKLLRSLAEVENQRRRFEKEIKDAFEFGSFNFAKESLSILDNLQRAKVAIESDETLKKSQELDKFLENITIIEKDLISIFEKNRIKKIITQDQKFDPNLHQAMSEIEDEQSKTGSILQEIQPGYMLGERLLRPALVAVAKRKTSENDEKNEKKDDK